MSNNNYIHFYINKSWCALLIAQNSTITIYIFAVLDVILLHYNKFYW